MKDFHRQSGALALMGMSFFANAESSPAIELAQMMKRMYSYSVHEFEYGRSPVTKRYDAVKNCAMLRTFFELPMLKVSDDIKQCGFEHSRFAPDAGGAPIEELVNENNDKPPVAFIQSIKVSGDQAQIDILFGAAGAPKGKVPNALDNRGRVVFYVKQLPQGWRIVNKLEFRQWPLKLDGEGADCKFASLSYHFILAPRTAADLAFLPPACQKLE
jgi:hypothetical protein